MDADGTDNDADEYQRTCTKKPIKLIKLMKIKLIKLMKIKLMKIGNPNGAGKSTLLNGACVAFFIMSG